MNKNMTQPICFRVEISEDIFTQKVHKYFACLCDTLNGIPNEIKIGTHYSRPNIAMSCNVYFFSIEAYSQFAQLYAKMLEGDFERNIWERANGIILDDITKNYLIEFGKILNQLKPVIDYINKNGGLLDNAFPGFDALEKALNSNTLPDKVLNSYNDSIRMISLFLMVSEQFEKLYSGKLSKSDISNEGIYYKGNIKFSFFKLYKLLENFSPCINFINDNGGWHNSQIISRGFAKMKKYNKAGKLSKEVLSSLEEIKTFLDMYLPIAKYVSENEKDVHMQTVPHKFE